jgi:hypothetical protein
MKVEFIKPENSNGLIMVHGTRYFFFGIYDTIKDAITEIESKAKPEDDVQSKEV